MEFLVTTAYYQNFWPENKSQHKNINGFTLNIAISNQS